MSEYVATVEQGWPELGRGVVRLMLGREVQGGFEVACQDGTTVRVGDGVMLPENAGLVLPIEALEALARALGKFLGNQLPSQAEVAVLRDVLAHERRRVDGILARAIIAGGRNA